MGYIVKLNNCSDQYFFSPIFITVKRGHLVKFALDSKSLNKSFRKNKYRMSNVDALIESISQIITDFHIEPHHTIFSPTIDIMYAYNTLNFHRDTAKHCNFNILSGELTGKCNFNTSFSDFSHIPAKFKEATDYTLIGFEKTFC